MADYLTAQGHKLVAKNHRTKFYEIDLITTKAGQIFFTEVKYRKTTTHGAPLEAITKQKQQQMRFAAESFLKYATKSNLANLTPVLAVASVFGPDFHLDDWFTIQD